MGWFGHGLYHGDGTQSCHYDYLIWMKITDNDEEAFEWMSGLKTKIPSSKRYLLRKNYKLLLNKMPKHMHNEDDALDWQMLLSLFIDNEVKAPKIILDQGIKATEWLLGEHASKFNNPGARCKSLRSFLKRVEKQMKI
jgi:hypothetical protein